MTSEHRHRSDIDKSEHQTSERHRHQSDIDRIVLNRSIGHGSDIELGALTSEHRHRSDIDIGASHIGETSTSERHRQQNNLIEPEHPTSERYRTSVQHGHRSIDIGAASTSEHRSDIDESIDIRATSTELYGIGSSDMGATSTLEH